MRKIHSSMLSPTKRLGVIYGSKTEKVNPDIMCLNYLDYQKDIASMIKSAKRKLNLIEGFLRGA